jgi:hypothetical protein
MPKERALEDNDMPVETNPPSDEEIKTFFLNPPPVPERTFEFALVLGGTVSAGAYTAGAIDFLIEALDCLADAPDAPKHKVVLKLIAGTSGGGVNAAIAARALAYRYPHVSRSTPTSSEGTGNPFYDIWVNQLRLSAFLDLSDLDQTVVSLLNGAPIDRGAETIIEFAGSDPLQREWVAAPLRVILTVTNLRGVPYKIDLGNGLSQTYINHADYMRFAVKYPHQALDQARPDESILTFDGEPVPQATTWEALSVAARATAAFPVGFPPRELSRPTNHYRYRPVLVPGENPKDDSWFTPLPDWRAMAAGGGDAPDDWRFLAVDGGATDNEPIQLARTALAGLLGRNPRDPNLANRAVWLIDPFAGEADLGPAKQTAFLDNLGAVASTLTQQTRYDTSDLQLAADQRVFSRFMLTPTRINGNRAQLVGADAIASSGLDAFIGFACPDFMRFDYLLGRANCQHFLRDEFMLGEKNRVFEGWSDAQRKQFQRSSAPEMLPIVPLLGSAAVEQEIEPWPAGKLDPTKYRASVKARYDKLIENGIAGHMILAKVAEVITQDKAADYIIVAMNAYLEKAALK